MDKIKLEQIEINTLECGAWGTIGPHSQTAAASFARFTGATYGLLCHSADAAYEALLRHFGARFAGSARGDVVITGECSTPSNSLVALCVGSTPLFCPTCQQCGMIAPDALEHLLKETTAPVRAVVLDYLAENETASNYPLERVLQICQTYEVPLILNLGGWIGARHGGLALTTYADAVLYSLGAGSAVDVGMGGLITTNHMPVYEGAFAYHNCGRGVDNGCTLVMDQILGGDFRVTEWTAAAAEEILRQGALTEPLPRVLPMMKGQPVFEGDCARRIATN